MWTTFVTTAIPAAHDWLAEVISTLRLGAALASFTIAIHRALRYWQRNRKR
jgi:hypothetical protein